MKKLSRGRGRGGGGQLGIAPSTPSPLARSLHESRPACRIQVAPPNDYDIATCRQAEISCLGMHQIAPFLSLKSSKVPYSGRGTLPHPPPSIIPWLIFNSIQSDYDIEHVVKSKFPS